MSPRRASAVRARARLGRRQPRGRCVELCGCLLGSPPRSARGRRLDLRRDGVVRDRRARREVASALLGVRPPRRQAAHGAVGVVPATRFRRPPTRAGGGRSGSALDRRRARLPPPPRSAPTRNRSRAERPFEDGPRRAREGGRGEHEVASAVRQAVEALGHEILDAAGHRKRVADGLFAPWRASACAISRAKNGLPPETSVSRPRVGRVRESPRRERTIWCTPASESGAGKTRSTAPPGALAPARAEGRRRRTSVGRAGGRCEPATGERRTRAPLATPGRATARRRSRRAAAPARRAR